MKNKNDKAHFPAACPNQCWKLMAEYQAQGHHWYADRKWLCSSENGPCSSAAGGHDVENLANLALVHEIEHCAT